MNIKMLMAGCLGDDMADQGLYLTAIHTGDNQVQQVNITCKTIT
jgi:hypothetical protein